MTGSKKQPDRNDVEFMFDDLAGLGDAVCTIGEAINADDQVHGKGLISLGHAIRAQSERTMDAAWPLMAHSK